MLALKQSIMLSLSMLLLSSVRGFLMSSVTGSLLCSASVISWIPKRELLKRQPLDDIRGGGVAPSTSATDLDDVVQQYLQDPDQVRKFHIQGWRWHTMSVAREAERLQKLALRVEQDPDSLESLRKAADYVVNFNLKALHRVEKMFFPWIRKQVNESRDADAEIKMTLRKVMDDLQQDQKSLATLGESITRSLKSASMTPEVVAQRVAVQSGQLLELTKSMLEREVAWVIPTIGLCISEREQKKFNNQVIKFLGVFESRTHLVHMHEVVTETGCAIERNLWEECIPSLPRSMIPRWKRTLYEPRAGVLDAP